MKIYRSKLFAMLAVVTLTSAEGAVVVVAPTSTVAGSLQINNDITFTVTRSQWLTYIVFMDWAEFDGSLSSSPVNGVTYSINNGPVQSMNLQLDDNRGAYDASPTSNNGSLIEPGFFLNSGDLFTLKANNYTLGPTANFNPLVTQTFTGNMVLVDGGETIMSNIVPVPEPSSVFLVSLGTLALFRRTRKRQSKPRQIDPYQPPSFYDHP